MQQFVRWQGITGRVTVAVIAALFSVMAGQAVAGGFSSTCKDVSLRGTNVLAALCDTGQGDYQWSSLHLDWMIGNFNGALGWGGSKFSTKCQDISLQGSNQLQAKCRRLNNLYQPATLNLDEHISNVQGRLKHE